MDRKGAVVEVWKGKEKRVEEKEVEKGERERVVLGNVLFVFCLTVSLPLPFFSAPTTPQHTLTLTHHPPYNMTHWCTPSHANRAVRCAAFFWEWTVKHTLHHPHPTLHHLTPHNTHQQTQHRHGSWCMQQQRDDNNQ